jgi:hypothetical protein
VGVKSIVRMAGTIRDRCTPLPPANYRAALAQIDKLCGSPVEHVGDKLGILVTLVEAYAVRSEQKR